MSITVGDPFQDGNMWRVDVGTGGSGPDKQILLGPFRTRAAAKREGAKLKNKLDRTQRATALQSKDALGEPDGSLGWYGRAMDMLAQRVVLGGGRDARDDLKALAFAANARKQLHDMDSVEEEVKRLRDTVYKIESARKYGLRVETPGAGTDRQGVAAEPIH